LATTGTVVEVGATVVVPDGGVLGSALVPFATTLIALRNG
jgi:hypothetical protein